MKAWYKVKLSTLTGYNIEVVEARAHGKDHVLVKAQGAEATRMSPRLGTVFCYFETFEQAKEFLIEHLQARLDKAKSNYKEAFEDFDAATQLESPLAGKETF